MTAESDVSALLSHATSAASSLASSSRSLIDAAIATIQKTVRFPVPPPPTPSAVGIRRHAVSVGLPEPKPGFPPWPILVLDSPPALRSLNEITTAFSAEFPELSFPEFSYPAIAGLPAFDFVMPTVDSTVTMPDLPAMEVGFTPDRMESLPVETPLLALPPTTFLPIDTAIEYDPNVFSNAYTRYKDLIFGGSGGIPGVDPLLEEYALLYKDALIFVMPILLTKICNTFSNVYAPVLAFDADIVTRMIGNIDEAADQVKTKILEEGKDRSGWAMPKPVYDALLMITEFHVKAWKDYYLSQYDTRTKELSMEFFETTSDLFNKLYTTYIELRKAEVTKVFEAHSFSLAYAKQTIAALLKDYEVENFTKNELETKKHEAELAVFEAELKLAMTRFELAKAQLETEQGRLENDSNLIKLYQADLNRADLDVKLYAAQVSAARSEAEVNSLPQEVFALQVRMFDALINAHESKVRAYLAEVATNEAVVDGELAKVKAFEAEAQAFNSLITAKAQLTGAQADRNKQVVDEYSSLVKAEMARIEQSSMKDQHRLAAYEVQLEDVLADAKLALKKLSVDLEYDNRKVGAEQQALDATNQRSLALVRVELDRLKAIAEVNARGASIMANMAEGAMSAANGVAGVLFEEF